MTEMTDAAREAQREYMREWRKKNPERVRAKNKRYWEKKAQKLQASVKEVSHAETDI